MEKTGDIHRFRNNVSAINYGNQAWSRAYENGLINLRVDYETPNVLRRIDGHEFVNLCSCSYLGLHSHPAIIEGAIEALRSQGAMDLPITRIRLRLNLLEEFESLLSELMGARTICAVTSSVATAGVLPLIASGHLSPDGKPPVMVFDKFAHFCMDYIKPICADETTVLTCPHNDVNYLEDLCKKHERVAFVCDGVYSMGGVAPLKELFELQDRYGLFLFIDDSHSLSVCGRKGEGHARSLMSEVNPLTVIVASLGKGFGSNGGIIMLGPKDREEVLTRFGGPLAWSQGLNVAGIGAGIASAKLHNTPELGRLQKALQDNMALFDELVPTEQRGNGFPLKVIRVGETEKAVAASAAILERGFYTSAVFFPIVKKGDAGLRVMLRADNTAEDIRSFAAALRDALEIDETTFVNKVRPIPESAEKMRAVVAVKPGGPEVLKIVEQDVPQPGPDEVVIRVRAAALNHADLLQRSGEFPPPAGESNVLGVEIAGDVVACGSNAKVALGSAVFGLVGSGAYADYCRLDADMAIPIPAGFSYSEAAALPEVFFTADTTLFELGKLSAGKSVLIHGGGSGLGSACIQMAKSVGAKVACTVGSDEKAARAKALGADLAINYKKEDFVQKVRDWTNDAGVDVVEDIVGGDYLERNLSVLKEGGCLVLVGVMSTTNCQLDLDAIILRRLQVKGSIMRALPIEAKRALTRRFRERWLPLLASRKLSPIVDSVFSLSDVSQAQSRMERSEHFGKIVLDLQDAGDVPVLPSLPRGVNATQVKKSLIDISAYDLDLNGPDITQTGELPARVAQLLTSGSGYCVLYGTNKILARHGLDVHADREKGYELLESIFKSAMQQIDMSRFSVTPRSMSFTKMDVDGYNLNESFSHDGNIASRAFMTSKCLHFDAATPFIGNIYGPNENIGGGHPVICDVRSFCHDRGVKARQLVENIPNNYNIAIKKEFYEDLKDNYSFGLHINLDTDIIIIILLNEIDFGIAHGATSPYKQLADKPARRPIRHFEYLYAEEDHYGEWYQHYDLPMLPASDYNGENLSLDYHEPARHPYQNLVHVNN